MSLKLYVGNRCSTGNWLYFKSVDEFPNQNRFKPEANYGCLEILVSFQTLLENFGRSVLENGKIKSIFTLCLKLFWAEPPEPKYKFDIHREIMAV